MAKQGQTSDVTPNGDSGETPIKETPVKYTKMINLSGNPARLVELFAEYFDVFPSYFVACLVAGASYLHETDLKQLLAQGEGQAGKFSGLLYSDPTYIPQTIIDKVNHVKPDTTSESD